MSSTDDLLDELRRKQAEERQSVGQLTSAKEFFRKHFRRFAVAGIVAVILSALALTSGIGYTANVNVVSAQLRVHGHPCYGYLCNGTMNASFNRFCYPVNHLFGSEVSKEFTWVSEPYDSSGESVKEHIVTSALLSEFPVNVPFFFVIGYVIAAGLDKSIQKIRSMKK